MSVVAPVLLVEDDATDVLLLRRAFERAHVVNPLEVAADGDLAVACLSRPGGAAEAGAPPVLVLLDLKLPRRGGLDVLRWLRQQDHLRTTPVVVLTSSRDAADLNEAYELGANGYLVKPVSFEALLRLVQTLDVHWLLVPGHGRAGAPEAGGDASGRDTGRPEPGAAGAGGRPGTTR